MNRQLQKLNVCDVLPKPAQYCTDLSYRGCQRWSSLLVPLFIAKKSIFKSCRGKIFRTRLLLDGDIELIYIMWVLLQTRISVNLRSLLDGTCAFWCESLACLSTTAHSSPGILAGSKEEADQKVEGAKNWQSYWIYEVKVIKYEHSEKKDPIS